MPLYYLSPFFLGWALGANDSANIFGTAVSSKMVKYRTAVILTSVFILAGAVLQGKAGIHTITGLTDQTIESAFYTSLAAALTVSIMTFLKLPISTSQCAIGAVIGLGFVRENLNLSGLTKIMISWLLTPIGAFAVAVILYYSLKTFIRKISPNIFFIDSFLKAGLIAAGCYGAYALGANNVANVTGNFAAAGMMTPEAAVFFGALFIVSGVLTFSKGVMKTVGRSIVKLDAFSAFIAVLAHAVTVHIYALIGVPVSASQAIVGAVLGIGFIKGVQTINFKMLGKISTGWLLSPLVAFTIAATLQKF